MQLYALEVGLPDHMIFAHVNLQANLISSTELRIDT